MSIYTQSSVMSLERTLQVESRKQACQMAAFPETFHVEPFVRLDHANTRAREEAEFIERRVQHAHSP